MGAQRLLERDRWREFVPGPPVEPVLSPPSEIERQRRLRHYRDTGEWKPAWGAKPSDPDRSAA